MINIIELRQKLQNCGKGLKASDFKYLLDYIEEFQDKINAVETSIGNGEITFNNFPSPPSPISQKISFTVNQKDNYDIHFNFVPGWATVNNQPLHLSPVLNTNDFKVWGTGEDLTNWIGRVSYWMESGGGTGGGELPEIYFGSLITKSNAQLPITSPKPFGSLLGAVETIELHNIAVTGSWKDLLGKPSINLYTGMFGAEKDDEDKAPLGEVKRFSFANIDLNSGEKEFRGDLDFKDTKTIEWKFYDDGKDRYIEADVISDLGGGATVANLTNQNNPYFGQPVNSGSPLTTTAARSDHRHPLPVLGGINIMQGDKTWVYDGSQSILVELSPTVIFDDVFIGTTTSPVNLDTIVEDGHYLIKGSYITGNPAQALSGTNDFLSDLYVTTTSNTVIQIFKTITGNWHRGWRIPASPNLFSAIKPNTNDNWNYQLPNIAVP